MLNSFLYLHILLSLFFKSPHFEKGKSDFILKVNDNVNDSDYQKDKSIADTVKHFFEWYIKNKPTLDSYELVKKVNNIYRVDFEEVERYTNKLRSSNLVDDGFINKLKAYLNGCDKNLIKHKQTTGTPEGFDYNFILYTQEDDNKALKELLNADICGVRIVEGDIATMVLTSKTFQLGIKVIANKKRQWRILSISGLDF